MPTPLNPSKQPVYKFLPIPADKGIYAEAVDTVSIMAQAFGSNSVVAQSSVSTTTDLYIGVGAGASVTVGTQNVCLGPGAGNLMTTPTQNAALGYQALNKNITGASNTAVGYMALSKATSSSNVAVGASALSIQTSGIGNTSIGYNSGLSILSAGSCVFLGYYAGAYETGSNVILIDNLNRTDSATSHASAPFYAVTSVTPTSTSQLVQFNCGAMGFYGTTAIAKPTAAADVTNFTAVGGTTATSTSTWTGPSGATAYTVGDIVAALKALGLLTA